MQASALETANEVSPTIRILLVEDNPGDARLVREELRIVKSGAFEIVDAQLLREAVDCLEAGTFDVILLDMSLPDGEGISMVTRLGEVASSTPIVVLTGRNDEATAIGAVRAGASDYLVKGQISGSVLERSIRYSIERQRLVNDVRLQNKQLEHFAFATAHDLKAPLGNVEQSIEFLLYSLGELDLPDAAEQGLQGIQTSSRRMRRLVSDLLVLGRTGSQNTPLEPVDLDALVGEIVGRYVSGIRSEGAEVTVADDLPAVVGYARDLEAVFDNLIGNALKYVRPGVAPVVDVGCTRCQDEWLFEVRDNGPGFPPENAHLVFEPYQRLSTDQEGTGLGLAIVKKAVEAMGGRVWLETEPDKGTAVRFVLPIVDLPAAKEASDEGSNG